MTRPLYNTTNPPPTPIAKEVLELLDHVFRAQRFGNRVVLRADQVQELVHKMVLVEQSKGATPVEIAPRPPATTVPSAAKEEPPVNTIIGAKTLGEMTMPELKKAAKEAGVKSMPTDKKDELITKIEEATE